MYSITGKRHKTLGGRILIMAVSRVPVHSQESKPESGMTVFCIISDIWPISDNVYHIDLG